MSEDKVIDKILKLLAKAESTTEAEAEALTAKAHDLMVRAEIDDAMLAHRTGKSTDKIVEKTISFRGSYKKQQRQLMFALGHAHGFRLIRADWYSKVSQGTWVGFESDIERVEVLLTSLLVQQQRAMLTWSKDLPKYLTAWEKFVAKRSHMEGFAEAVGSRLARQRAATVDAAESSSKTTTSPDDESTASVALVLRTKDEQVDDWYDKQYGHLRTSHEKATVQSGSARSAGHEAGQNADLGSSRLGARKELGR